MNRIFITGAGIVSAIGNDLQEVIRSLYAGKSGIGPITLFPTLHQDTLPVAEVKLSEEQLLVKAGLSGKRNLTRTTMLGIIAAKEALTAAFITPGDLMSTALVSATTVGGMDRSESFYQNFLSKSSHGRLRDVVHHDCADSTEWIARVTGIKGFVTTISTACSSSANAIMFGANLIRSGLANRVVAGGTDAMTRFTLNGFNTLMILDKSGCHPFDDNRAGLTLGEGAAFVVLESENQVMHSGKTPLAMLSGFGNANDAYHQTASSPDGTGAFLAMSEALRMAGLQSDEISYINVHGTGTENNDLSEGVAMQRLFGESVPLFSSTKGFTGHTLGAAGAIEAVISVLSLQNQTVFPNLGWRTPMKELYIRPVSMLTEGPEIRHVLSNSFGFGGNNSSLILSKLS